MTLSQKSRVVHQTALRVFAIWQWLSQEHLPMRAIQEKLVHTFGDKLSLDAISIYLNTLKRFDCDLSRPKKQKGYYITAHRYVKRVFSDLTPAHLDALCDLAEQKLSFHDYIEWLAMLDKLAQWLSLDWQAHDSAIPFDILICLQTAIEQSQLVMLSYQPATNQLKQFPFLPQRLRYSRRRLYVQGARQAYDDLSMLRLSRIQAASFWQDETILNQLRLKIRYRPYVVIAFPGLSADQVPPLLSQEQVHFDSDRNASVATLETRDFFGLTQTLLSGGYPFEILQPESFAVSVRHMLQQLAKHHG